MYGWFIRLMMIGHQDDLQHENTMLRMQNIALAQRNAQLSVEFDVLQSQWNSLVGQINARGGQQFLDRRNLANQDSGKILSDEDIKRLLMLVHPDKHGGKQQAHEMTQKLLSMRGSRS